MFNDDFQESLLLSISQVPEFIGPVFSKTSPKRSFSLIEGERFELVFAKIGSINTGTVLFPKTSWRDFYITFKV